MTLRVKSALARSPCRICTQPRHLRCGHDGRTEQLVLGKPVRNLPTL